MTKGEIYVEIDICSSMDVVWELTQNPMLHPRWDARFSSITPTAQQGDGVSRFQYALRLPFHQITGSGTSIGERITPDGSRTSALRFTTNDLISPIRNGRGYWRYVPTESGVRFITGYDYSPGWGQLLDRLVIRRAMGWLTAWSFDRLRIWAESGVRPETWSLLAVAQFWRTGRPRAACCRREPRRGRAMDDAPATLAQLVGP